ncbi:MAG: O-antigen ligase family protein [Actinomycetota bacterium]|nr:O-antigen ligase family protein [Actinomycetota bacterium]MDQ2982542.1 O-antigen ligase family protein [Actinomycetota bacterium]
MRSALAGATTHLPLGAAGILLAFALLASAGSSDDRLTWIGSLAVLVAGAAVALGIAGAWPRPILSRWATAFLGLFGAFVAWNGLSILWSVIPGRSWDYFNRGLVYAAFLVVGLFVGPAVRALAFLFAALVGVVLVWALAAKMIPALALDSARIARIHTPIGYWNALALLIVMAVPVALWIAARREHSHNLRAAAVVLLYACTVALLLTFSRGGILLALLVVAAWLVVGSPVLESAAALAVAGLPGVGVALWSFTRPGLADDGQTHAARVRDGGWFALVFLLVGVGVAAAAYFAARYEERTPLSPEFRRRLGRVGWAGLGVTVVAFAIWAGVTAKPREWFNNFTNETTYVSQTPSRLTTLTSSSRWQWWDEAWRAFEARPVRGTGAGSFELTHRLLRRNNLVATEPHNVPLQFLSELGIVGLLLFLGCVAAAVVGVVATLRRLKEPERAAGTALALALLAYQVHSIVDFDWDFVAVTGPALLLLGALLAAGRPAFRRRPPPRRLLAACAVGAAAVSLAAIYSLAAPWLARRNTERAYEAIDRGATKAALEHAKRAHNWNPLALDPLLAWASAEEVRGDADEARRLYVEAVNKQPLNWRAWYELGQFELVEGRLRASLRYLDQAAKLDPYGGLAGSARDYVKSQL